jgi:hypothetical protein
LIEIPRLLRPTLGEAGQWLFAAGLTAAVFTSFVGFSHCLAGLSDRCWGVTRQRPTDGNGVIYHLIACSALVTSLLWTLPGMPGALQMALVVNCAQIVLVPLLALSVWILTARSAFIGPEFRNNWWENTLMAILLCLSIYGTFGTLRTLFFSV